MKAGRIALVACHWIGDTFWASQVVPALRQRFPAAELYAISQPHCLDLWEGLIAPDRRLAAGEVVSDRRRQSVSWSAISDRAAAIKPIGFDLVIDLTGNRYSAWFTFLLRPGWSIGFDGNELGALYSHRVARAQRAGQHLMLRPFRVIEPLLGRFVPPKVPCPPKTAYSPAQIAADMGLTERRYVVMAPGAGWPAKCWPAEKFSQVRQSLTQAGMSVVITGSSAQTPLAKTVAGDDARCRLFMGQPLGKVIALLDASAGFVGNDSGSAHLSAAIGKPTAVIFTGATDPASCRPIGPPGCVRIFQSHAEVQDVAGMF